MSARPFPSKFAAPGRSPDDWRPAAGTGLALPSRRRAIQAEKKGRTLRHASCTIPEKSGTEGLGAMEPTSSTEHNLNGKPSAVLGQEFKFVIEGNELILRAQQLGHIIKERVCQTIGRRNRNRGTDEVGVPGKQ